MLNILKRVAAHQIENFVAPVFDSARTRIMTSQDGMPFSFRLSGHPAGWWEFSSGDKLTTVGEAQPRLIVDYVKTLPAIRVVVLFALSDTTWLCVPYNPSDAHQKGWKASNPLPLHLVRASIESLDVVLARAIGGTLIFDQIDRRVDQSKLRAARELLRAGQTPVVNEFSMPIAIMVERQAEIARRIEAEQKRARELEELIRRENIAREEAERRRAQQATFEGRLQNALSVVGAQLQNWSESGRQIEVRWSIKGQTYRTYVNREAEVTSAGFCMNRTDGQHDLTTMVLAVLEAERLRRPDLYQIKGDGQAPTDRDDYDRDDDDD